MKKEAVKVTFTHQVTKQQLIESLDRILNFYGCPGCGLNGWGGIYLLGDPDPGITTLKGELINEKINSVINVEHFNENLGQRAEINQG